MKKNIILLTIINAGIIFFGCNSSTNQPEKNPITQNQTKESKVAAQSASCYILENQKDTVSLK